MKRFLVAVLLSMLLAFAVAGCKKAHRAGNDSMSIGGTKTVASLFSTLNGVSEKLRAANTW
jgi:hypothetical protein